VPGLGSFVTSSLRSPRLQRTCDKTTAAIKKRSTGSPCSQRKNRRAGDIRNCSEYGVVNSLCSGFGDFFSNNQTVPGLGQARRGRLGGGGRTPGGQKQAQTPRQRERETGDLARGERFEAGRGAHWGPTGVCYSGRGPLQNVDLGVVPVTLPPTTNLKKKTCQRTFKNGPPSHGLLHVNSMGQCHLSSLGAVWETPSPRGDLIAEWAKRFNASSTPPPLFF